MFEPIKNAINQENKRKVTANQRYLNNESPLDDNASNSSEHSFEQELNNRIEVFNLLTKQDSHWREKTSHSRDYEHSQLRRHQKEVELLEERIKINEEMHQREIQYLSEKHEQEIKSLQLEVEKCEFASKRHSKEEGLVSNLRKDNKRIIEMHEEDQRTIERLTNQISNLKRDNLQIRITLKKKEESEAQIQVNQSTKSEKEAKLQKELDYLLNQKQAESEKKKQMEVIIHRLKAQNNNLERQLDKARHQSQQQLSLLQQKYKGQLQKIEQDNTQLKKRNQLIEDSFIDHLTQTSLNLQQNLRAIPQRTIKNNSSLYLQQSPIRTRSKDRERQRRSEQQDPQKKAECKCTTQVAKLRAKLEQANGKIVQLLREKCQVRRK